MAKIFQLELFIKEMSIWKLPNNSEECDETCVEVNVFDVKKVPICGYVFGKSSTMNRGQNFLFTLVAIPTNENKVFLNIFKKAFNRNKNFLGSAKIPIEVIFNDIFSQTFSDTNEKDSNNVALAQGNQTVNPVKNKAPTVNFNATSNSNTNQSASTNATNSLNNASIDLSDTANSIVTPNTSVNDTNVLPTAKSNPSTIPSTTTNSNVNQPTDQKIDASNANANPTISSNAPVDLLKSNNSNIGQSGNADINSLGAISDATPQRAPIARLTKDVYPIIGADSKQWGSICILMRLTSFGDFSAHPIHIHQSHNEIILENTPNTAMYKCIQLDDLKRSKRNERSTNFRKQHEPMNYTTDLAEIDNMNYDNSDSDLCPCPPVSPNAADTQYEEYKAEVNGNALCVRVPKNTGIVRRIYDNYDQSPKTKIYLDNSENVCNEHIKSIPVVRGNRKYPAHYGVISRFPSKCNENSLVYDQKDKTKDFSLQCTENRILEDDKISCPSDVQIIRRNDDPKRDVFVLKIGKESEAGAQNGIQLEMRTPKNPFASRSLNTQTTSVQTYDDEFVSKINSKSKKGKKSGKKGGKKK